MSRKPIILKEFTENLECQLTESEIVERAREAATLHDSVRDLEEERKNQSKRLGAEIRIGMKRLKILEDIIQSGIEHREVDVAVVTYAGSNTKDAVRQDVGAIVWSGDLTDEDRQLLLDYELPEDEKR